MKWRIRSNVITDDVNKIMMERLVLKKSYWNMHLRLDVMIQINNEKGQTKKI